MMLNEFENDENSTEITTEVIKEQNVELIEDQKSDQRKKSELRNFPRRPFLGMHT